MHLLITVDYSNAIAIPAEHANAVLLALPHAQIIKTDGYGTGATVRPSEKPLEFSFQKLDLDPLTAREKELIAKADDRNSAWADAYTENEANKKRIAALEARLAALTGAEVEA